MSDFFLTGPPGLARGGSTADAGPFQLQLSLNGKLLEHCFFYTNLTLFNYYYRKCTCSTMAGLHTPRRQACRRSPRWRSRLSTTAAEATRLAPPVEE